MPGLHESPHLHMPAAYHLTTLVTVLHDQTQQLHYPTWGGMNALALVSIDVMMPIRPLIVTGWG